MKSIGILYVATGSYIVFWKNFYESFEKYFLPNLEKHYYIFTDAEQFYADDNPRVHRIFQKPEPWPLPTLLKYHRFLEIQDALKQHDYLYQSNGPIVCNKDVLPEDFLPREELGEQLMFTQHPGYRIRPPRLFPYERRRASKAYVPYGCGQTYVFGAMNGGKTDAYLAFMEMLAGQISQDLNKGLIARFHDESYVNHYVELHHDFRLLPCSYGYPDGMDIPDENIIACVNKSKYFDVDSYKGTTSTARMKWNQIFEKHIGSRYKVCRDVILRRKTTEV
jgi:hypothetical protein